MRRLLALMTAVAVSGMFLVLASAQSERDKGGGKKEKGERAAKKDAEEPKRISIETGPQSAPGVKNAPPISQYVTELVFAAREGGADVLSNGDSYDDFPSVAQTSDGTIYVAYAAYYDNHDQIRIHRRLGDEWWSTRSYVPLAEARADVWMPQLAVDAKDHVWVIWSEQTPSPAVMNKERIEAGNWDLYARPLLGDEWGELVRLTDDPKPDINHHVTVDAAGNIHVVWQAHPENNGDIRYCQFDGEKWSRPLAVTSDPESDWYPRAAADKDGTVWIAFDSYRRGDYDVYLTSVRDGEPGKVYPIAASGYYEAHPSVACTPDGRVWVAWEQGGFNWGKDQGYWLREQERDNGTPLGRERNVKVAAWKDGEVLAAPEIDDALPEGERRQSNAFAELAADEDGRVWLRFRHMVRERQRRRGRARRGWTENVTWLTKDGWAQAVEMPASAGRISVFSRVLPAQDGSLLVAYAADARSIENYHRPIQDNVLFKQVPKPDEQAAVPERSEYKPPEPPVGMQPWNSSQENRQVAAIRRYRGEIDGRPHRIVRGDLHRHTELSWDVGPGNDGSFLDFYRYMIDVAQMDFGSLTDHQGGGHYPYWWWLTEKSCDMYYLPPRYVPLYGYERSVRFPHGHRNVFHAYRGVPIFPFRLKLGETGVFPGVGTSAVLDDDTKLLYQYLHGTGGIAISHTSGTSSMGTDWRDNDPEVEPVVEIYQGARNSYEALGAPRVHPKEEDPDDAPGGFQEAGLVWKAYEKGYRLGTTSSSDHGSTHISYSMVYTPENDRQAIIDSIRRRHTYGATDNLIVDFQAGDHFMGDEFESNGKPQLRLKVAGTSRIAKLDLIRNNEYIYTSEPKQETVEFNYTDEDPAEGTNLYYIRLLQDDGEVAWSSPVWVNWRR